jgi:hypothetical protein
MLDDLEQTFDTLSDGMDGKLNNAARYFEYDPDEIEKDDYSYRYDTTFQRGSTYSTKVCRITILTSSVITVFILLFHILYICLLLLFF